MCEEMKKLNEVTLDGVVMTEEELAKKKEALKGSERIVETAESTFHLVEKMNG